MMMAKWVQPAVFWLPIASFLALLEKDIAAGKHVSTLPDELANALLSALQQPVDPGEDIQGDVAL